MSLQLLGFYFPPCELEIFVAYQPSVPPIFYPTKHRTFTNKLCFLHANTLPPFPFPLISLYLFFISWNFTLSNYFDYPCQISLLCYTTNLPQLQFANMYLNRCLHSVTSITGQSLCPSGYFYWVSGYLLIISSPFQFPPHVFSLYVINYLCVGHCPSHSCFCRYWPF